MSYEKNIIKKHLWQIFIFAKFVKKNVIFHIYLLRISKGAISSCFLESSQKHIQPDNKYVYCYDCR